MLLLRLAFILITVHCWSLAEDQRESERVRESESESESSVDNVLYSLSLYNLFVV